jgi:hypothetical protein
MITRFPAGFAAGLVLLALAGGLASCQDTEEETSQVATEGPTASPTAATPSASPTPLVTFGPTATPETVPEDWGTLADPGGSFTVRYPPAWFINYSPASPTDAVAYSVASLYSFDPAADTHGVPSSGVKIDIEIALDKSEDQCVAQVEGATATTLGGVQARRVTRDLPDFDAVGTFLTAYRQGRCYTLAGYTGVDANTDTFDMVVQTFVFQ